MKKLLENKEMVFKNGVKNIQTKAYNGARMVYEIMITNDPSEKIQSHCESMQLFPTHLTLRPPKNHHAIIWCITLLHMQIT